MDNINVYNYLTPNISLDPTIALAGSQAQQFNAGLPQTGSVNQQAYSIEYQVPYAIRYSMPLVVSDLANAIGVPDIVGNGTGSGAGSNNTQGPPGPPGVDGSGTPSGPDMSVQFNDAGSFNGVSTFTFDNSNQVLRLLNIKSIAPGAPFSLKTDDNAGNTGSIQIITGVATGGTAGTITISTSNSTTSGDIDITCGTGNSGDLNLVGNRDVNLLSRVRDINISSHRNIGITAVQSNAAIVIDANGSGGSVGIAASGSSGSMSISTDGSSGFMNISAADSSGFILVTTGGGIEIDAVSQPIGINFGTGQSIITLGPDGSGGGNGQITLDANTTSFIRARNGRVYLHGIPTNAYTDNLGTGTLFLDDASNNPTHDPASGGILYVTGGALTYRGSAGTVTTIAPA